MTLGEDTSPYTVTATISGPRGHKTQSWILDTGASIPIVSKDVASSLGLKPIGSVQVQTATGIASMPIAMATISLPNGASMGTKVMIGGANVLGLDVIHGLRLMGDTKSMV